MDPEYDNTPIGAALRALARKDRREMASAPHVQSTLRAHVRATGAARSRRRFAIVPIAAAAAGLVFVLSRAPAPTPLTRTDVSFVQTVPSEVTTEFLPLLYGSVPLTDGQVVRIEVPRTALTAFGLASESPELTNRAILADVLVGPDSVARAVRFVHAATDYQETTR